MNPDPGLMGVRTVTSESERRAPPRPLEADSLSFRLWATPPSPLEGTGTGYPFIPTLADLGRLWPPLILRQSQAVDQSRLRQSPITTTSPIGDSRPSTSFSV